MKRWGGPPAPTHFHTEWLASRLRKNNRGTVEIQMVRTSRTTGEHRAGCSERPDFSPSQPWRAKTRLGPSKAAASNQRWFFQACLCMLSCGGSNESPAARWVRPFQFSPPLFRGVAEAALYCAHRTSTVSSCVFCEQEGHLAAPSPAGGLFQHPARWCDGW